MDALMPFAHGSGFTGSVTQNNLSVYVPTIITVKLEQREEHATTKKSRVEEDLALQAEAEAKKERTRRRPKREVIAGSRRETSEAQQLCRTVYYQPLLPKDERIVSANPSADASIIRPSEDVAKKPGSSGGGDFSTLIQCRNIHRINKIYHMKLLIRFEKRGYESDHNLEEDGYSEGNLISPPKRKSYQLQYVESSSHS